MTTTINIEIIADDEATLRDQCKAVAAILLRDGSSTAPVAEPDDKPKRGRGRPRKAEAEPETEVEAEVKQEPEPKKEPEPESEPADDDDWNEDDDDDAVEAEEVTLTTIQEAFVELSTKIPQDSYRAFRKDLAKKYGVTNVKDFPEDKYAEILAAIRKTGRT